MITQKWEQLVCDFSFNCNQVRKISMTTMANGVVTVAVQPFPFLLVQECHMVFANDHKIRKLRDYFPKT